MKNPSTILLALPPPPTSLPSYPSRSSLPANKKLFKESSSTPYIMDGGRF